MIRAFDKIRTQDPNLELVQSAVARTFTPILACPILDGVLIEDIALSGTAETTINHLLQKKYRGWMVVRQDADTTIWESESPNAREKLVLNALSDVTVSLWVF